MKRYLIFSLCLIMGLVAFAQKDVFKTSDNYTEVHTETSVVLSEDDWIHYDDGVYLTCVGTGSNAPCYWAVSFPAAEYAGNYSVSKVAVFDAPDSGVEDSATATVCVYLGGETAPGILMASKNFTMTASGEFIEVALDYPIPFDGTQTLWITVYAELPFPAAGSAYVNNLNSDWISLDGVTWEHASVNYGLNYSWMLRAYIGDGDDDDNDDDNEMVVLIEDDFEEYVSGNKIASSAIAAGNDWWTTWTNAPGSSEDATVVTYDGTKCGFLSSGNDQVLKLGKTQSGVYDLEFDILVPNGKSGYFNILHNFDEWNSTWAMQAYLHLNDVGSDDTPPTLAPGYGTLHAGGNSVATIPCVYDEWMHFRLHVNIDTDEATFYITHEGGEEQMIHTWQWSLDSFGGNVIGHELDAMNFFPPVSSSEFYLDNFKYTRVGEETAPEFVITPDNIDITLYTNYNESSVINIDNVGTSFGDYSAWIDYGVGQGGYNEETISYAIENVTDPSGLSWTADESVNFEVASLFPASAYGNSVMGTYITKAAYMFCNWVDASGNPSPGLEPGSDVIFRIYGQGHNGQPGKVLAEKVIKAEDIATSETELVYTIVEFDEPVALTGYDVYVAVEMTAAVSGIVMTLDGSGQAVQGYGDLYRQNNGVFYSITENAGYNYGNWCLKMYCEGSPIVGGWATLDKTSGSIAPGNDNSIIIEFDTHDLGIGEYNAVVRFNTNEIGNEIIDIPVTLNVIGENDVPYYYSFENGMEGWTTIDADGDGYAWYHNVDYGLTGDGASGNNGSAGFVFSQSYDNYVGALNPDNYLVSPQKYAITAGSKISFYACAQDANYQAEHFGVAVSTAGNTSAADFTTVSEWTFGAKVDAKGAARGYRNQTTWTRYEVDLSAYAGQNVWVAIRHFNCTDQYFLDIDDISIVANEGEPEEPEYGPNRKVIIEEFTGRNCAFCPDGHRIANEIAAANPGKVFPIVIHAGTFSPASYPNLNTEDGVAIMNGFNVNAFPTGEVNRTTASAISRGEWAAATNNQLAQVAEVNVNGDVTIDASTRTATITVELDYTSSSAYSTNYLTVMMLQDSIWGSQSNGSSNPEQYVNGQYCHMHVLRDVITSTWGDAINNTTAGSHVTKTYTYYIPEVIGDPNGVEVDLDNIYFLAIVTETNQGVATRPVLNVNKLSMSGVDDEEIVNHWTPDASLYPNTMTMIGVVEIDGVEQTDTKLEVGAFCGDEVRGSARLEYQSNVGRYMMFMTLYGNTGDNISFKLYDHNVDAESDYVCGETVSFVVDDILGGLVNPYIISFASDITQSYNLQSGWNWYSTYIEVEGSEGLEMMQEGLGDDAIQIKSHNSGFVNYEAGIWFGGLTEIKNEEMYMIKMSSSHVLEMTGSYGDPSAHPITLGTNWKWIGYPVNATMSVNEAFSNITPNNGDYVKSQFHFAQYYEGLGWTGTLGVMEPGNGYMYQNTSGYNKTLVYPTPSSKGTMVSNVTTENNRWVADGREYPANMTVIAVVEGAGTEYEVAAFSGGECRGSARPIYVEQLDSYMIFMTVYGEDGDEITFRYYDVITGEEQAIEEGMIFGTDATFGDVMNPYVMMMSPISIGEGTIETLSIYPNPVGEREEIRLGGEYDVVEVYNSIGMKVAEYKNVSKIDGLEASGVYVVRIMEGDKVAYDRIVVE